MGSISAKGRRTKGQVGDREVVHLLKNRGYEAYRGLQSRSAGVHTEADVFSPDLPYLHLEVKRTERFKWKQSYEQAEADRKDHQMSVVVFRPSRHKWMMMMEFEQFLEILDAVDTERLLMIMGVPREDRPTG